MLRALNPVTYFVRHFIVAPSAVFVFDDKEPKWFSQHFMKYTINSVSFYIS